MSLENPILTIGTKNGEMDFAITSTISEFSYEKMSEFRQMLIVAIGTAESMWRLAATMKLVKRMTEPPTNGEPIPQGEQCLT